MAQSAKRAAKRKVKSTSKSILARSDLPWLADKDGVEACFLYEDAWREAIDSGWAVYRFDPKQANRAINFFPKYLKHMKGKFRGKPVNLENWQKDFIGRFFGWVKILDGFRRFQTLFLFVPRKNGKSLIVAGLALYLLLCDKEGSPEVYVGASTESQANLLFTVAKYMVRNNKDLTLQCQPLKRSIFVEHSDGTMQCITGVAETQEGTNPSAFVGDEVHTYPNNELLEVMETGMGTRDQPSMILLTTAGKSKQGNPAYEQYQYACQVRDGIIKDPSFLGVLYEAPADAQIEDWEAIKKANPNFGISVNEDYFVKKIRKARYVPALRNSFLRHNLNIWCDADDKWLEYAKWLMCKAPFDNDSLQGRRCYAGLDLAQVGDINALVLLFPPVDEGERYKVLQYFWCPEDNIVGRSESANVPYLRWSEDPDSGLIATPGEITDYEFIKTKILELDKLYQIAELAFDPYNATMLTAQLAAEGINCIQHKQTAVFMNEPIKGLMRLILGRKLQHYNEILDWMANNAVLISDSKENFTFDKKKSTEKIDAIVALAMAAGRALLNNDDGSDPFEHGLRAA